MSADRCNGVPDDIDLPMVYKLAYIQLTALNVESQVSFYRYRR